MAKLKYLKTDQDFEAFRSSKSFQTPSLKIRARFRSNQNNPRFGFIVPKKVLPRVVDRNLIKRRIKAILEKVNDQIKNGAEIIFYPQRSLVRVKFEKLEADIKLLFTKANLWK